jgi:uncharacterized repeat protein (TIGR03803 family)
MNMPSHKLLTVLALLFLSLVLVAPAHGAVEQVLYSFCQQNGCSDGSDPQYASLIFDTAGNLYGTTLTGGAYGFGTVFELTPEAGGTWTETVLYNFCSLSNCADGGGPFGGVVFDKSGNLYGTTEGGGTGAYCSPFPNDCGAIFELTPGPSGQWSEHVLYSFCSLAMCADGSQPVAGLTIDSGGNLYGTTGGGGKGNCKESSVCCCGTVFELVPGANGSWRHEILHSFGQNAAGGEDPSAGLTLGPHGSLYGTTLYGGILGCGGGSGCGVVFELTATNGKWTEKTLHAFGGTDGGWPYDSPVLDANGNLYGTNSSGGPGASVGVVFKLTREGSAWSEEVLHPFFSNESGGYSPYAGVIFGKNGSLYGVTRYGGLAGENGLGAAFKLDLGADGKWKETTLHDFGSSGDGILPGATLIFDSVGNLYGTTAGGGTPGSSCGYESGCGTVFELTP